MHIWSSCFSMQLTGCPVITTPNIGVRGLPRTAYFFPGHVGNGVRSGFPVSGAFFYAQILLRTDLLLFTTLLVSGHHFRHVFRRPSFPSEAAGLGGPVPGAAFFFLLRSSSLTQNRTFLGQFLMVNCVKKGGPRGAPGGQFGPVSSGELRQKECHTCKFVTLSSGELRHAGALFGSVLVTIWGSF